ALALTGTLNALALGEDFAASLGTRVHLTRVLGILAVTLLAGGATALRGGIGFVGLMVPHIVRWFTGPDQRWIILYSALAAPVLVLAADVGGRVTARPGAIEVSLVTAVIGARVLIALLRRRKASGLGPRPSGTTRSPPPSVRTSALGTPPARCGSAAS